VDSFPSPSPAFSAVPPCAVRPELGDVKTPCETFTASTITGCYCLNTFTQYVKKRVCVFSRLTLYGWENEGLLAMLQAVCSYL
jgi:hypothetical protein